MEKRVMKYPSSSGDITVITLINSSGGIVELSTLGAGINRVRIPENGGLADYLLGYGNPEDYLDDSPCCGKTPGRFANRIAQGKFSMEGKEYRLTVNNPPNALHGGPTGFHNRIWEYELLSDGVRMYRFSPDYEEGYPGNLQVEVDYRWRDDNSLSIKYSATTDRPTPVNLTNHAYFNLDITPESDSTGGGSILDHILTIPASQWLEMDDTDIPTGLLLPVDGTPMDFRKGVRIGRNINTDFSTLKAGKGFNHFFILEEEGLARHVDGKDLHLAAELRSGVTGRGVRVYTTAPGVMLYTGNWLAASPRNRAGVAYCDHSGVALECHTEPDAPNHDGFTDTILRPGEIYDMRILYEFD